MNGVDALDRSRERTIWLALVGFALLQVGDLARQALLLLEAAYALRFIANCVFAVGIIVWFGSMVLLWWHLRRVKANPSAAAALDDEVVRDVRLRASAAAFFATVATLATLTVVGTFVPLPARLCVQFTILVAVTVFLAAFLHYRGRPQVG